MKTYGYEGSLTLTIRPARDDESFEVCMNCATIVSGMMLTLDSIMKFSGMGFQWKRVIPFVSRNEIITQALFEVEQTGGEDQAAQIADDLETALIALCGPLYRSPRMAVVHAAAECKKVLEEDDAEDLTPDESDMVDAYFNKEKINAD